jgi:diguanylate cyclase (GGDEF)-like protein/PAS domain S-box-containing protein
MDDSEDSRKPLMILSLEDSPMDSSLIYEYLRENLNQDFHIDTVMKEQEFVSAISTKKYDLILSDFILPDFGGFEALRHLKLISPNTPLICLSGGIGEEAAVELLKNGAVDYVSKDKMGRLIHSVERAIREAKDQEELMEAQKSLIESSERLNLFFRQSLSGFFFMMIDEPVVWDNKVDKEKVLDYVFDHQRITKANQTMLNMYHLTEEEYLFKTPNQLIGFDVEGQRKIWRKLFDNGNIHVTEWQNISNGERIYVEGDYICLYDSENRIIGHFGTQQDITKRKLSEELLKASEEKYRLITENASDVIWVFNIAQNKFTYISPSIFDLRGITVNEALKENLSDSLSPESFLFVEKSIGVNVEEFMEDPKNAKRYISELQQKHKNGAMVWVEISTRYRYNEDREIEAVGVSRNIDARKKIEVEILYLSYHDQLTGLYNRRFYEEELKRLDTVRNLPITIAIGDVNGLKLINDSFGHPIGDELLIKVAKVIKRACRADDIVARLGGDEFVIILPDTTGAETEKVILRIKEFAKEEKIGAIDVSISFGFETKSAIEEDIQEIFSKTEDNLFRKKLYETSSMRSKTIDLVMNTLYEKNPREMLHSKRVSEICEAIAFKMNLDNDMVKQLKIAGLMHDIGKIGIDEKILNKPDKLTDEELKEIQKHSEIGYRILSSVNEFSEIAIYVLEHQEKWDGSGYPKGLKGEAVSLQARIIAIADSYDAMTSHRKYKESFSEDEAIDEIIRCSGHQFDQEIAKIFVEQVMGKVWK